MSHVSNTFLAPWFVSNFLWFFVGISHNLTSRRSWLSALQAYAWGILTSWWRFKVGSRFCSSFHSFFELAAVLRGVLHVFSRVFFDVGYSKMLRDHILHVFFRVVLHFRQWQIEKFAFSSCFVDESGAASDSDSILYLFYRWFYHLEDFQSD